MRWPFTLYTDSALLFRKDWIAGMALGPVIAIRPKYRDDVGMYRHELTHVRQFFRTACVMPFLYLISAKWRARFEAEAYAEQTRWPDRKGVKMPVELGAWRMAQPGTYNLDMTMAQCADLIRGFL